MATDIDKLQGTWTVAELELDGQKMGAEMLSGAQIVLKGDVFRSLGMGAEYEGTLVVDEQQRPKAFELRFTSGPEKGNSSYGIYELKGNTWRICLSTRGNQRPKQFATAAGTGYALETLRRGSKVSKTAQSADVPSGPGDDQLSGEWQMVSASLDGRALEEQFVKMGKRVCEGNRVRVSVAGQTIMDATYRVDRSTTPHGIDYVIASGPHRGRTQPGIFECNGRELKVSMAAPGGDRPSDFSSQPGDGRNVTLWRRK